MGYFYLFLNQQRRRYVLAVGSYGRVVILSRVILVVRGRRREPSVACVDRSAFTVEAVMHHRVLCTESINQSSIKSCIFRVVQVIKSLQDPLQVENNLPGINDNVRERGLEHKCF